MVSRGWSYFLIGLLLSSFLGGAIRVFFSPPRIRAWVEEVTNRKQPKFTLEFSEVRLALAHGWTPGLAVEFIDLKIKSRDQCVTGSELLIDRLNLPLRGSAVFSQKVKFGVVAANNITVKIKPPECDSQLKIPAEVEGLDKIPTLERLEKFMNERWKREIQNTIVLLDGMQIHNLEVLRKDDDSPFFSLKDFTGQIIPKEDVAIFDFSLEPGVSIVGNEAVGKLRSHLRLSPDALTLSGRGNLKEGQYVTDMKWDLKSGFWDGQLNMRDMPASSLLSLLGQWGLMSWANFNPRNQWFRCELKSEGSLVSWRSAPVRFESCGFYGELGEIQVHPGESRLFEGQLYPITAHFRQVDMGPLLAQFGAFRQWVGQEGQTNGELQIKEDGNLEYSGVWRQPQFHFPKYKFFKIGGIAIDQMDMTWKYDQEKSTLELSKPTAYGQDFPFYMKVSEDKLANSTELNWLADWKEWPKAMLKITDAISSKVFHTRGKIRIGDTDPLVDVSINADSISVGGVMSAGLKSHFGFTKGKGSFKAEATSLKFKEVNSASLVSGMLDLVEEKSLPRGGFRLSGEFDQEGRWVVNPFEFKIAGNKKSRAEFVGRGFKLAVDQGVFRVFKNKKVSQQYNVFGSLSEPRFEAQ